MSIRNTTQLWDKALDRNESLIKEAFRPLYSIDYTKDDEVLKWVSQFLYNSRIIRKPQVDQWSNNIGYYKGHVEGGEGKVLYDRKRVYQKSTSGRVVVNEAYEIVEQKVAHIMRYKPEIAILPANIEYSDRDAAEMAQYVVSYLKEELKVEKNWEKFHRHKYILGESYVHIFYDPYGGPVHPDYERLKEEQGEVRIKNSDGESITVDVAIHTGEVACKVILPHQIYFEPVVEYEDSKVVIVEEIVDIEDIRAQYGKVEKLKGKDALDWEYPGEYGTVDLPENKVRVYTVYHEKHPFLEKGRYIKCIPGKVLANTDHIYQHGKKPVIRLSDIDIPGDNAAMSTLENVQNLNKLYNIALTNMARAVALMAHPKIFYKKGSVQRSDFVNHPAVIEYKDTPPTINSSSVVSRDVFAFKDEVRKDIERHSGVHGISRGDPPPGIRAGIALQFLEEQENQRANAEIIKNNIAVLEFWTQVLGLVGQFYKADDGRTFQVVGKNGEFTVKTLKEVDLSTPFAIRIQNTSSLPESKAGRTQAVLDYREILGEEVVPNEQVADMLGLAQPEKFITYVSAAVRKAEGENEDMLRGNVVQVSEYDEHITHWLTHYKAMQVRGYQETSDKVKEKFRIHLMSHERLMFEKMKNPVTSPSFTQRIAELENFPVFYTPEPTELTPVGPQDAAPMGGAPGLPPELTGIPNEEGVPVGEGLPPEGVPGGAPLPPQSPI